VPVLALGACRLQELRLLLLHLELPPAWQQAWHRALRQAWLLASPPCQQQPRGQALQVQELLRISLDLVLAQELYHKPQP